MSKPFFSPFHRLPPLLAAGILLATAACAQAPAGPGNHRQLIIGFTTPTNGPARQTLDAIEQATGTRARYVSSLSERSHAYLLNCPPTDADCESIIAALRHAKGIDYIQADHTRKLP